jgi:hypothetical protein
MRNIKFRAWDSAGGMLTDITGFECSMGQVEGIFYDGDYIGIVDECRVLMQSTGLRDKNGREIYEGDILEEENGYLFEVVWDAEWAKFKLQWRTKAIQYPEWNRGKKMVIVGNIHDNPGLLLP